MKTKQVARPEHCKRNACEEKGISCLRKVTFGISILLATITYLPVSAQAWTDPGTWDQASKSSAIHHAPNGNLGKILSSTVEDSEHGLFGGKSYLLFRERNLNGTWGSPELVVEDAYEGAFFYDAASQPLVFVYEVGRISLYRRSGSGMWSLESSGEGFSSWNTRIAAAQDYHGHVHFVIAEDSALYWERWDGEAWHRSKITDVEGGDFFFGPRYEEVFEVVTTSEARNLSVTVDRDGFVHVVFGVQTLLQPISGGTRIRSELRYTTNQGGAWRAPEVLLCHASAWGDAGTGASIAAAPDGTLAVAATFLPRVQTGSPGRARLEYLHKSPGGVWNRSTVSDRSDNYIENDGERGTGMHPQLTFDEFSRPHLVFTDHASGHFGGFGARSFTGQVRYATRGSPIFGAWSLQTVVSRGSARAENFLSFAPAVSAVRGQVAILEVSYIWDQNAQEYGRSVNAPLIGTYQTSDPGGLYASGQFGEMRFTPMGPRTYAFSESLGAWLLNRLDGVRSSEFGGLSVSSPGWLVSSHYGFVHFGNTFAQYGGWIWSERFGWMKLEDAGAERYLWVPMMNSWMSVNADGTFYSFQWRHLTQQGMNRYHSSVFGGLTTGDFGGWVASDRFGWMWANGDSTWFWSQDRGEWLGVTHEGGIWSTAEGRFL